MSSNSIYQSETLTNKRITVTIDGNKIDVKSVKRHISGKISLSEIVTILSSKPHNKHYLMRYCKFIKWCLDNNVFNDRKNEYFEDHHIAPKSSDLFPEYFNFIDNPWNKVSLSARQHFIAHWMLWKTYKGTQTYAFKAMCNKQKSKYQSERYSNINSKTYTVLKEQNRANMSSSKKGRASYYDQQGKVITCSTSDPRVLSGELTSTTKNRKCKPRKDTSNTSKANVERKWREYPTRTINLFFLDIKLTLSYTRYDTAIVEYLDQGWSTKSTPEYSARKLATTVLERNTSKLIDNLLNGDYSSYILIYDTIDKILLMGDYKTLTREYPSRYSRYASNTNFKRYKNTLTNEIMQLDPTIFPIMQWLVEIPLSCSRKKMF